MSKRLIKEEDRKVVVLKAGEYRIDGLLVEIKDDTQVVYAEEEFEPEYMKGRRFLTGRYFAGNSIKTLQHDPNGSLGNNHFSKFNSFSEKP